MRYEVSKIRIWSLIKTTFFVNTILALVVGFSCFLGFIVLSSIFLGDSVGGLGGLIGDVASDFVAFGLTSAFLIPLGILGAAVAMVMWALLYNLIARFTGGIELELDTAADIQPTTPALSTTPAPSPTEPSDRPPPPPPLPGRDGKPDLNQGPESA